MDSKGKLRGVRVEYEDGLCKGLWATSRTASRTNSRRNVIKPDMEERAISSWASVRTWW